MKKQLAQEQVIIFTRYPKPGMAKTRLIPLLGPEGAADLQRRMTENCLTRAEKGCAKAMFSLEIWYDGGSEDSMRSWLGSKHSYLLQKKGDIGTRMHQAFESSFNKGFQRVVIIGSDCPDISEDIIIESLKRLRDNDLIIGPATDGGYYLIGLRSPCANLFEGIEWGASSVLADTLARASSLGLKYYLLTKLQDVDIPADLDNFPDLVQS